MTRKPCAGDGWCAGHPWERGNPAPSDTLGLFSRKVSVVGIRLPPHVRLALVSRVPITRDVSQPTAQLSDKPTATVRKERIMAIFVSANATFVKFPKGSGTSSLYKDDIVGVLLGIEPREGTYEVADRTTGEIITRPNSWTARFADGSRFSWPTYLDEDGNVQLWSRFDESIDLSECAANGIAIHVWRDARKLVHLELAVQTEATGEDAPF